jgi:hypothetical protein
MNNISIRSVLTPLHLASVRALENTTRSADFTGVPDTSIRRQASRALFMRHQARAGGVTGRVGIPMGDLRQIDNRVVKTYSGGLLELFDFTDGPQGFHKFRAEVRFVGFRCHQQSEGGDGDEPYFIIGIIGSNEEENVTKTFGPFTSVKSLNNTFLEKIVTTTAQPPFTIVVMAMENDSGSPAEASAKVEKSLNATAAKLQLALPLLGVNPVVGSVIQSVINIFGGTISDATSAILGMGDDLIGESGRHLIEFDSNIHEWTSPPKLTAPDFDRPFNIEMVIDNGEGGRYSAFFQVDLFQDTVAKI